MKDNYLDIAPESQDAMEIKTIDFVNTKFGRTHAILVFAMIVMIQL